MAASVTRWLDNLNNIGPFIAMKIAHKQKYIPKNILNFAQNKLPKASIMAKVAKFRQIWSHYRWPNCGTHLLFILI